MDYKAINLVEKFGLFEDTWTPKVLGETNGQLIKLAKLEGEFVWHAHEKEDELFYVVKGQLTLRFRDGSVTLNPGEIFVVPAGKEHLPVADKDTWVMLIEPKSTLHTGSSRHENTVDIKDQKRI